MRQDQMLILVIIVAIVIFAISKKKKTYNDIAVPVPTTKRTDLLFGYYSCFAEQVAETKDHINFFHESQFNGIDKAISNILEAKTTTCLDLQHQLLDRPNPKSYYYLKPNAETELREFFVLLKIKGALPYVKYLSVVDEPNNTIGSAAVLAEAVNLVKKVAREFRELEGVKYFCIYAADKSFICQEMFDLVGFDDYDKKSSVLSGKYQSFKQSLLPHQKTIIIPGGAYGQDPVPFVNFAQTNMEVGLVMPFLWFDDTLGNVGKPGIRSGALKDAYIAAGKSVINP